MSDEWISIQDRLPKLGERIEVETEKPLSIMCATLKKFSFCQKYEPDHRYHRHDDSYVFYDRKWEIINHVTQWRPLQEKRPDFSKLKKDDILLIKYSECENTPDDIYPVRFSSMNDNCIFTYHSGNHVKDHIKKITRINLEKQTFEEI